MLDIYIFSSSHLFTAYLFFVAPEVLLELKELVRELQHAAADIKRAQQREAQLQRRCPDTDTELGEEVDRQNGHQYNQASACGRESDKGIPGLGHDSDVELDLSGLNEMHDILGMLRARAAARSSSGSISRRRSGGSGSELELDLSSSASLVLSSFPRGPAAERV
jgi:hypothetical protein